MIIESPTVLEILGELERFCESVGKNPSKNGYAADFNNGVLGDPYLFGTAFLPTQKDAETFAAFVIPLLDALAVRAVEEEPRVWNTFGWTDARAVAQESYATIVSAEHEPYGGDPQGGDPIYEEVYFGDAWLVAGASLGILTDEERERLDSLAAVIAGERRGLATG